MSGYLANTAGSVPLVLDIRIAHERWGSSSDPSINGHLHYPNDFDRPLNETDTDKIRQYRTDYNNRTSKDISFIPAITSTSGRTHGEFVRLLFLQVHRENDHFFAASGVQLTQHDSDQFHYRRVAFSSQLKSKIGNILAKAATLRITLNIDGTPVASPSHTHPGGESPITLANLSSISLVSIFRCSSPPHNPVYVRPVDPSSLAFGLSSHRHSYRKSFISTELSLYRFIKKKVDLVPIFRCSSPRGPEHL